MSGRMSLLRSLGGNQKGESKTRAWPGTRGALRSAKHRTWPLENALKNNHGLLQSGPSTEQLLLAGPKQTGGLGKPGEGQPRVPPNPALFHDQPHKSWARYGHGDTGGREVEIRNTFGPSMDKDPHPTKVTREAILWIRFHPVEVPLRFWGLGRGTGTEVAFLTLSPYPLTVCTLSVEVSNKFSELVTWPTICKRLQNSGLPNAMEQAGNRFSLAPIQVLVV